MSPHYLVKCQQNNHGFGWRVKNGRDWSSSSREPRLTANITVNMFSVAVYYLTSVQNASATPGPCSRTAHRHTLLGTHSRTCVVRTSRSSSLSGPKQPGLESSRLRCLGRQFSRWSINVDDSRQSTSYSLSSSGIAVAGPTACNSWNDD